MGDWFMIQTSNGCLVSKVGLVADIMGGDRNIGAGVIASVRHGEINQKWSLQGNLIQSKMTGLVMEVKDGKMVSGTEVTMMEKRENTNQMWLLYTV